MNLNESRGIDAFLIESLSVCGSCFVLNIKTDFECISDRDDLYVDMTHFNLENVFSQR
jgi:hypothetical protein